MLLSEDVLDAIEDEEEEEASDQKVNKQTSRVQIKKANSVKKFDDNADPNESETFSDFIPLKTYA